MGGKDRSCCQTHPRLEGQTSRLEIQNIYYLYRDQEQVFYGGKIRSLGRRLPPIRNWILGAQARSCFRILPYLAEKTDRLELRSTCHIKRDGEDIFLKELSIRSLFRQLSHIRVGALGEQARSFLQIRPYLGGGNQPFRNSKHLIPQQGVGETSFQGRMRIAVYAANGSLYALVRCGGIPVLASKPIRT